MLWGWWWWYERSGPNVSTDIAVNHPGRLSALGADDLLIALLRERRRVAARRSHNGEVSATPCAWLRSGTERRGRCRNLCCTKPRAANPAYGYLIKLAAAALRASKERTDRVSLGTAANRAICSCVSCSSVILLERSRRTEQRGRSMVVAMGGSRLGTFWVEGGSTGCPCYKPSRLRT